MNIRFLGHAACEITDGETTLLIDPFITGNPVATVKAEELHADYILVTHSHGDHIGDAVEIAKRTGATIIINFDAGEALEDKGVKIAGMGLGGKVKFPFGMVRMTMAFHGSGAPGALPNGFVIHMNGKRIYHAGDTCLYGDMKLLNGVIEKPGIDVALMPIGDHFTMGPEDAAIAAEWIAPKVVIPIHWGTFPMLTGMPDTFTKLTDKLKDTRTVVLYPGDGFQF